MGDQSDVCCLCGDVGFPEKLFRCRRCNHRLQHSYCSNYYGDGVDQLASCDWCRREEIASSPNARRQASVISPRDDVSSAAAASRARTSSAAKHSSARRYKLLKDVLC